MKRKIKAILTVLSAAVLAFNLLPVSAKADTALTAALYYGNSDWSVMWSGETATNNTAGATGKDAIVTGVGTYTVSLDFTGTENGCAPGEVAFTAPAITGADTELPGYFIDIDEIKLNGEAIEFVKGYTNDEGGATRMNITNVYCTAQADTARSVTGDLSDATWNMVEPAVLTDVKSLEVTFTVYDAEGNGPAVEEVAATDDTAAATDTTEAAADDTAATTDVPKTGVVGLGLVYGLGAIATGAAVLKRKEK